MYIKTIVFFFFIVSIPAAWAAEETALWMNDFDEALALAETSGKDLLVDFSGSDWCKWCIKLDEEVFSKPEFVESAAKEYILVVLDFPQGEELQAKIKNPERNKELVKKFNIRGYPTVLLVDKSGHAYAKTGYREGGPELYIDHLKKLKTDSAEIKAMIGRVTSQTGEARAKELSGLFDYFSSFEQKGLEFQENFAIAFPEVNDLMKEAFTLDADNKKGLKLKAAQYLLGQENGFEEALKVIKELDPKNELGECEKALQAEVVARMNEKDAKGAIALIEAFTADKTFKNQENEAYIHYLRGHAHRILEEKDQARAYFEKAKNMTSNAQMANYINKLLEDLDS
ncbi:MAG: thioredoxin family protein [Planctomycetota bacterium]